MLEWLDIKLTAWRLGLRDKGELPDVKESDEITTWSCPTCNTRARAGIVKDTGKRVWWCWRCEQRYVWMHDPMTPPDDDEEFLKRHNLRL